MKLNFQNLINFVAALLTCVCFSLSELSECILFELVF